MGTRTKRFLTREEFIKNYDYNFYTEIQWNPRGRMDYLFGCIYTGNNENCIPIQYATHINVVSNKWNVYDNMLTDAPHPYMDKLYAVRIRNESEWNTIQAKGFACGFKWINSEYEWKTYKHMSEWYSIGNVTIYISNGIMFTGVEEPDKYISISIEDFMLGNVPSTKTESDTIPVQIPVIDKYMCVMNPEYRKLYGSSGTVHINEPLLLLSDDLDSLGGRELSSIDKYLESGYHMISCTKFMTLFPPNTKLEFMGYEVKHIESSDRITIGCGTIKISSLLICADVLDLFFSKTNNDTVTQDTLKQLQNILKKIR
jgi:hypothetical protein